MRKDSVKIIDYLHRLLGGTKCSMTLNGIQSIIDKYGLLERDNLKKNKSIIFPRRDQNRKYLFHAQKKPLSDFQGT